jgi:hypothetical protein
MANFNWSVNAVKVRFASNDMHPLVPSLPAILLQPDPKMTRNHDITDCDLESGLAIGLIDFARFSPRQQANMTRILHHLRLQNLEE